MSLSSRLLLTFCSLLLLSTVFGQGFRTVSPVTDQGDFNGQRLENLAVRSNGEILVTVSSPVAAVYQVSASNAYAPIRVAGFPKSKGAFGIVELGKDKFYIATSDSTTKNAVAGSSHLFEIDMTGFKASQGKGLPSSSIRRVADLPNARFPNGLTAATGPSSSVILIADSRLGCVWRVDSQTGEVTRINEDTGTMAAPDGSTLGINGVKVVNTLGKRYLFYTNTGWETLHNVLIKPLGAIDGGPSLIQSSGSNLITYDDFDVNSDGTVYLVSPTGGLYKVESQSGADDGGDQAGPSSIVNDGALNTPTSVRFGRGTSGQGLLYVTANTKAGGGVFSVDISP